LQLIINNDSRSLSRGIAKPAKEAAEAEMLLAAPLRLPLFELHHIVDSPVEEG
jgi:hypothetical protein